MSAAGPLWKALVLPHEKMYRGSVEDDVNIDFCGRVIRRFPRELHPRTDESEHLLGLRSPGHLSPESYDRNVQIAATSPFLRSLPSL